MGRGLIFYVPVKALKQIQRLCVLLEAGIWEYWIVLWELTCLTCCDLHMTITDGCCEVRCQQRVFCLSTWKACLEVEMSDSPSSLLATITASLWSGKTCPSVSVGKHVSRTTNGLWSAIQRRMRCCKYHRTLNDNCLFKKIKKTNHLMTLELSNFHHEDFRSSLRTL